MAIRSTLKMLTIGVREPNLTNDRNNGTLKVFNFGNYTIYVNSCAVYPLISARPQIGGALF